MRVKQILILVVMFFVLVSPALAFFNEVQILPKEEIAQLSDEKLNDVYREIIIERTALETFYARAGFTPKDYQMYKELLEFIVNLREEMTKRKIEPLPIMEWLK